MKNIRCRSCFNYRDEWCEKVVDSPHPDIIRDCQYYKEMTNADRIRAMSDEELAVWLGNMNILECDCCIHQMPCRFEHDTETVYYSEKYRCGEGIMAWLQQPAEEVDHDSKE